MELGNYLEKINVKNIISIDDEWKLKDITIDIFNKECFTSSRHYENVIEQVNKELLETYPSIVDFISSLENRNQDITDIIDDVIKILSKELEELNALESVFTELEISFAKYKSIRDFDYLTTSNTLLILDVIDETKSDNLIEKLADFFEIRDKNNFVIIYTHDTETMKCLIDEKEKVKYLGKAKDQKEIKNLNINKFKYYLWGLSKDENTEILKNSLLKVIIKSIYGTTLDKMFDLKSLMYKKAEDLLMETNFNDIETWFEDGFIEGDTLLNQIERKITTIEYLVFNDSISTKHKDDFKYMLKNLCIVENYHSKRIEDNCKLLNNSEYQRYLERNKEKLVEASKKNSSDHLLIDYSVNKRCANPGFGDVFVFLYKGIKQYGLLISDECNCVIRNCNFNKYEDNPKREHTTFSLLILNNKNYEETKKPKNFHKRLFPIQFDNEYLSLESMKTIISIDTCILDYTTLNEDGKCIVHESDFENALEYKNYQTKRYYKKYLKGKISNEIKEIEKIAEVNINNYSISNKKEYIENFIIEQLKFNYQIDVEKNGKIINFKIQRLGRVRNNIVYKMLRELYDFGLDPKNSDSI